MATYEDAAVHRPDIRALMQKVRKYTVPDTKTYGGTTGYTDVRISTPSGTFERRVQQAETGVAWIVSDDDHDEKFVACASYVMGADAAREVLSRLRGVRELAVTFTPTPARAG